MAKFRDGFPLFHTISTVIRKRNVDMTYPINFKIKIYTTIAKVTKSMFHFCIEVVSFLPIERVNRKDFKNRIKDDIINRNPTKIGKPSGPIVVPIVFGRFAAAII